jgi:DNA-directed RNA polymerase subunit N (RpoN/RPB10)
MVNALYDRYIEQLEMNYDNDKVMDDQMVHQRVLLTHRSMYRVIQVFRFFELGFFMT